MFITLKVKYFHRLLKPLEYIDGKSDWIDLRCAETMVLIRGRWYLIPLGVAIKLPSGYEAHIVPRLEFKTVERLEEENRGGFGSTGRD